MRNQKKYMTLEEKIVSKANKYVMPSVEDYLGARCLLLNNIFVGLTLAHEATEKLMKALLILEDIELQKSHNLEKLLELLLKKNFSKYEILSNQKEFIKQLDQHYGWRYYDGDITKRSKSKSPEELHPLDYLYVALYELYMNFLPLEFRFRTYFPTYLFDQRLASYLNWGEILIEKNKALEDRIDVWRKEYKKIFNPRHNS